MVAYEVLAAVDERDAYANLLLPVKLERSGLEGRDAAFATELVYGCLRGRRLADAVIGSAARRDPAALEPQILRVLRLGAHEALEMRVPAHAVVNTTVDLVKTIGSARASGLVNAVMRRITERTLDDWDEELRASLDAEAYLSTRWSHPAWIVRAFEAALKADGRADELAALLRADNLAPHVDLVALQGDREVLPYAVTEYSPFGMVLDHGDPAAATAHPGVRVQDEGSQLVALVLSRARPVRSPEQWLDVCAGPGGKTALLAAEAAAAAAAVTLLANEPIAHRAELVRQAVEGSPVECVERDGVELMGDSIECFDRILIDAPCSGLGALRRRPEARWRKSPTDLGPLTDLQARLLDAGLRALRPGGTLVYSTCSPHLAETSRQIVSALRQHDDAVELDTAGILNGIAPQLQLGSQPHGVQLWPHVHGTDGMYICALSKRA